MKRTLCLLLVFILIPCILPGQVEELENRTHKGTCSGGTYSIVESFTMSYSLSTVMGEPVHDYQFYWELNYDLILGEDSNSQPVFGSQLQKYPDLYEEFKKLKPVSVTIEAEVGFAGFPVTRGKILIEPDLVPEAGVRGHLSVPGSPNWADFFVRGSVDNPLLSDGSYLTRTEKPFRLLSKNELEMYYSELHKEIFKKSKKVSIEDPRIIDVDLPEGSMKRLLNEYLSREKKEKKKDDFWDDTGGKKKDEKSDDFWSGDNKTLAEKQAEERAINFTSPVNNSWVNTSTVSIDGTISQFSSGKLYVNDEYQGTVGSSFSETVNLKRGKNRIRVNISDVGGKTLIINYEPDTGGLESLNTTSKTLTLSVWDHGGVDGDIVDIYLNGEIIAKNITLTSYKKNYTLNLHEAGNRVEIVAISEGESSPNTAAIIISDGKKIITEQSYEISKGEKAGFLLIY